jgi:hypothetical protein
MMPTAEQPEQLSKAHDQSQTGMGQHNHQRGTEGGPASVVAGFPNELKKKKRSNDIVASRKSLPLENSSAACMLMIT